MIELPWKWVESEEPPEDVPLLFCLVLYYPRHRRWSNPSMYGALYYYKEPMQGRWIRIPGPMDVHLNGPSEWSDSIHNYWFWTQVSAPDVSKLEVRFG